MTALEALRAEAGRELSTLVANLASYRHWCRDDQGRSVYVELVDDAISRSRHVLIALCRVANSLDRPWEGHRLLVDIHTAIEALRNYGPLDPREHS